MNKRISSPIRWIGSKRRFLNEMIEMFDTSKSIYVEPFMGSGVVFLNCVENKIFDSYYVNDVNSNITNLFMHIEENMSTLSGKISELIDRYNNYNLLSQGELYYQIRKEYNTEMGSNSIDQSIRFWFLMKAGYNGVYRENSRGCFNVPFGKRKKINFDENMLIKISNLMLEVQIFNCDYSDFINKISLEIDLNDSFIYFDPPYMPETTSTKNHNLYTKSKFSHLNFTNIIYNLSNSYISSIMISMSKSSNSEEMYQRFLSSGRFNKYMLAELIRTINPSKKLNSVEEVFLNYKLDFSTILKGD